MPILANFSRRQRRLVALTLGLVTSYAALKQILNKVVPKMMYFKRSYDDKFFGQDLHFRPLVISLLRKAQASAAASETGQKPSCAELLWERPLKHGEASDLKGAIEESPKTIEWHIELFTYAEGSQPQRGFLLLPRLTSAGDDVSGGDNTSRLSKLWVVYGGNAMLALDWVDILQDIAVKFDTSSVLSLLESPWISHQNKQALRRSVLAQVNREGESPLGENLNEFIAEGKLRNGFVLLDYPGYGLNQDGGQEPGQDSIFNSTLSALQHVQSRFDSAASPIQFAAIGHSIGCAAVLDFQRRQLRALAHAKSGEQRGTILFSDIILSAPFTSIAGVAREMFGTFLPKMLLDNLVPGQHAWRNDAAVAEMAGIWDGGLATKLNAASVGASEPSELLRSAPRVCFLHGLRDEICPHWMSVELARQVGRGGAQHVSWQQTGHNDLLERAQWLFAAWVHLDAPVARL